METVEVDVLVVGSGAGGLTSAIVAHDRDARVLVIEKTRLYGGTSATSGGGIWIPCNYLRNQHGRPDSRDAALQYLTACAGSEVSAERIAAYVEQAPRMLEYLAEHSHVRFYANPQPDYYPELPGADEGWRTLYPVPVSAAVLGRAFFDVRPPNRQTTFMGFVLTPQEGRVLMRRSKGWRRLLVKLLASYWLDIPFRLRTRRHRRLALGNALIVRCLASLFERKVPIWRECTLRELIVEDGAVVGAIAEKKGERLRIVARQGVILAAGGFESNPELRSASLPAPTDAGWSGGNGNNTGDAIIAAQSAGVGLALMDDAWWAPAFRIDGEDRARLLFVERGVPSAYIVNREGERFVDEASSYYHVGSALNRSVSPAWLIFDAQARSRYPIGPLLPGTIQPDRVWSRAVRKIVHRANSLGELAGMIGVPADKLAATAARVARFSEIGVDKDFGRGGNFYDRAFGDPAHGPNPCLGPLATPPFYAIAIYPGDLGTKGGIVTNADAQALRPDGTPVAGLYATGNNAASVMGRSYPGAGATLGAAMTFGYVAALHATTRAPLGAKQE